MNLQETILTVTAGIMFLSFSAFLIHRMTQSIRRRRRRYLEHVEEIRDVLESILILLRNHFDNNKIKNE